MPPLLTALALGQVDGSDPKKLAEYPWNAFDAAWGLLSRADQFLTIKHADQKQRSRQSDKSWSRVRVEMAARAARRQKLSLLQSAKGKKSAAARAAKLRDETL